MQKKAIRYICALTALALALTLTGCGAKEPDPHEGMVYVNTGVDMEWIDEAEGVAASDFDAADFSSDGNIVSYNGEEYESSLGVDVSFYQGEIDWEAAAADGVEFAMIRCGFRGSSEGDMFVDEQFENNIKGALAAGIRVGVYFFSQSTGAVEAAEEALFVLDLIDGYDVTMPVAFDWEPLSDSRSDSVSGEDVTAAAVVFCEMVKDAGYDPCVYFFRRLGYYDYDLSRLADFDFWVGSPGTAPDFYYAHSIWQFSFTGVIDGIDGDVDLDLAFTPVPQPEPSPTGTSGK